MRIEGKIGLEYWRLGGGCGIDFIAGRAVTSSSVMRLCGLGEVIR